MSRIALVTLSSQQKYAETEVALRLQQTIQEAGHQAVIINADMLEIPQYQAILNSSDTLFSICLHASIAKRWHCTSYVCLWDPFPWLKTGKYLSSLATHDDFLVIDSPSLQQPFKEFLKTIAPDINYHFDALLPSVSKKQCLYPIESSSRKLFYCGIGGENIFHRTTRLRGILKRIDKQNILNLYGPKFILGPGHQQVQPWHGYKAYQGEIPFDGNSLIETMSQSGISLVVSSSTHREQGVPSARIFEACASGNVIIADNTTYFDRWGDSIYRISFNQPDEQIAKDIIKLVTEINHNPRQAYDKAKQSQSIFLAHYSLEQCLAKLLRHHYARKELRERFKLAKQQQSLHQVVYRYLKINDCPGLKLKIKYLADKYHLKSLYRLNDRFNYIVVKYFKRVKHKK